MVGGEAERQDGCSGQGMGYKPGKAGREPKGASGDQYRGRRAGQRGNEKSWGEEAR